MGAVFKGVLTGVGADNDEWLKGTDAVESDDIFIGVRSVGSCGRFTQEVDEKKGPSHCDMAVTPPTRMKLIVGKR